MSQRKARILRIASIFGLLLAGFWISPPSAQADDKREKAKQLFDEGDALKAEAEAKQENGQNDAAEEAFLGAADKYQAAYELVPHPLMLYNIAQVYRLAGKRKKALEHYERFLETDPDGDAAEFARKYVVILRRVVSREGDGQSGDGGDGNGGDGTGGDGVDGNGGDGNGNGGDGQNLTKAPTTKTPKKPFPLMRYSAYASAAIGVLALGYGVKKGMDARSISNCLTTYPNGCDETFPPGQWNDRALALEKEGKSANTQMIIFTSVGAAAVIGGGVLYYLSRPGSKKAEAEPAGATTWRVAPQLGPDRVGAAVSASF